MAATVGALLTLAVFSAVAGVVTVVVVDEAVVVTAALAGALSVTWEAATGALVVEVDVVVVVADLQHLLELRPHQRFDLVDVHPLAPVGKAAQVAEQGDDVDAPAGDGAVAFGERGVEVLDVH